ncbi:MAG: adenosylmethionine decarboxylase [Oscillospiraceae bacterium]|nr:adenosylmethionine decarboxylase [Oscillospiraceae bacterium]
MQNKLKLHGFNNLTKSLCFNIYDFCYAETEEEKKAFIAYIDERYNAERLAEILMDVAAMIKASVLSVSRQDYDPQGASVTLLIAEEPIPEAVVAHLDKSHIAVHTYPECHPGSPVASFRADIDVATCGELTPLDTLGYLIGRFGAGIVIMDYKVRGFTRASDGEKIYMDHDMRSVQDYIDASMLQKYRAEDVNLPRARIFHTKMLLKEISPEKYLFGSDSRPSPQAQAMECLRREMEEIYHGKNGEKNLS